MELLDQNYALQNEHSYRKEFTSVSASTHEGLNNNSTGGWWHLNWGGQAHGNGWCEIVQWYQIHKTPCIFHSLHCCSSYSEMSPSRPSRIETLGSLQFIRPFLAAFPIAFAAAVPIPATGHNQFQLRHGSTEKISSPRSASYLKMKSVIFTGIFCHLNIYV